MDRLLLIFPLLLLAGCGPTPGDIVNEYRAAAEAQLENFTRVGKKAGTETELKDIELPGNDKLAFVRETSTEGNAALLQSELFYDDREIRLDLLASNDWFEAMPGILANDGAGYDPVVLDGYFKRFLTVKYAVVVRTRVYSEPARTGEATFNRGQWGAELLVYELESGAFLGGVALNVLNEKPTDVPLDRLEDWLRNDLYERAREAVRGALEPHTERMPFGRD